MRKQRARNPVYNFLCLLVPWRIFNTYYVIGKNEIFLSCYYAEEARKSFSRKTDYIDLEKLVKIGFPEEFNLGVQEAVKKGRYGKYVSQEVVFIFEDNSIISWNVRPYTKKQIKKLLESILTDYPVQIGEKLKGVLDIRRR